MIIFLPLISSLLTNYFKNLVSHKLAQMIARKRIKYTLRISPIDERLKNLTINIYHSHASTAIKNVTNQLENFVSPKSNRNDTIHILLTSWLNQINILKR